MRAPMATHSEPLMSSDMFFLSLCGCSRAVSGWDMGILSSSGDAFILPRAGSLVPASRRSAGRS